MAASDISRATPNANPASVSRPPPGVSLWSCSTTKSNEQLTPLSSAAVAAPAGVLSLACPNSELPPGVLWACNTVRFAEAASCDGDRVRTLQLVRSPVALLTHARYSLKGLDGGAESTWAPATRLGADEVWHRRRGARSGCTTQRLGARNGCRAEGDCTRRDINMGGAPASSRRTFITDAAEELVL